MPEGSALGAAPGVDDPAAFTTPAQHDVFECVAASNLIQLAREKMLTRTLVREVHHRIKNHLQGLIGLLAKDGQTTIEFADLVAQIIVTLRVSSPVPVEFALEAGDWQPIALSQEESVCGRSRTDS